MNIKLIPNFLRLLGITAVIVLIYQIITIKREISELRKESKNPYTQSEYYAHQSVLKSLERNKSEWNEHILKDCSTINSLLNLKERQLEQLSTNNDEIHFRNNLKKYKIVFSTQIINEWTNCGFIAPVEVINIHNITSDVTVAGRIFDKFITKRHGTASWIYLNDEKIKGEIFEALRTGNYSWLRERAAE